MKLELEDKVMKKVEKDFAEKEKQLESDVLNAQVLDYQEKLQQVK